MVSCSVFNRDGIRSCIRGSGAHEIIVKSGGPQFDIIGDIENHLSAHGPAMLDTPEILSRALPGIGWERQG